VCESFSRPRASYLHRRRPIDRKRGELIVTIASLRRTSTTTSTVLAMLGLAVLGLSVSASASAAPTFTLKVAAVPIPGFPGTGDILGAGTALQIEGRISGTEYGGFPPPLTEIRFFAPAGAKLHPQGFAVCAPSTIEASGPGACPRQSAAGPKGSAGGVVSFGTERVHETVSVQPFFAPSGNLEFYVDGTTPVSIEILGTGHVVSSAPPFGEEFFGEVPLIETVPGALDASAEEGTVRIGGAYKQGKKTISYLTVPKKCPQGGFSVKGELSFLGGATAEAAYKIPCPRK
jgi:hypothetical protein